MQYIHVSLNSGEDCYDNNEICIQCMCCSKEKNEVIRLENRITHHEQKIRHNETFQTSSDSYFKELQEKNIILNIKYHQKLISKYKNAIDHLLTK